MENGGRWLGFDENRLIEPAQIPLKVDPLSNQARTYIHDATLLQTFGPRSARCHPDGGFICHFNSAGSMALRMGNNSYPHRTYRPTYPLLFSLDGVFSKANGDPCEGT